MRLLGIKIQGGYSSEARVFASLLAYRDGRYDPLVFYHTWQGNTESRQTFERTARTPLYLVDVGLRPNVSGRRAAVAKVAALLRFRASFPTLLARARLFSPDVIYSSQQLWDCALASYIARRLGRQQVIHLHYTIGPWLRTGFSANPQTLSVLMVALGIDSPLDRLRSGAHVITVSDFIRTEALHYGVGPEKVTTIRNAVPILPPSPPGTRAAVRAELGAPLDAPLLGIVGRLDPDKGQEDTLAAFARIAQHFPTAYLVIVGDGPRRTSLALQAAQLQLADRVVITGYRTDVPRLLDAMDVFAHPSRREPFGLAIAEASAAGLPVVAYDEGGIPEIVSQSETGLLAPAGDIEDLARCLERLLADPALAQGMGARGKERMRQAFHPAAAGRAFAATLERISD